MALGEGRILGTTKADGAGTKIKKQMRACDGQGAHKLATSRFIGQRKVMRGHEANMKQQVTKFIGWTWKGE